MKLLTKITTIYDRAVDILIVFSCLLLTFMTLAISANVFLRYFLNKPQVWAFEISGFILLYLVFLGAGWLLKSEGHVKVDFVVARLSTRSQNLIAIITSLIAAIACLVLVWYGTEVTWDNFEKGVVTVTVWRYPKFALLLVIPLGSFLLFIQFLRRSYKFMRVREEKVGEEMHIGV
ncbi:TRAP transporter small permease [Chloroflexota bacterium]